MIRQVSAALAALALAAPLAAQDAPPDPKDWQAVTEAAEGQTVYWNAWGGSSTINDYIDWAAREVEARHGHRRACQARGHRQRRQPGHRREIGRQGFGR